MQVIAVADDLSGAAEIVAALGVPEARIWLYSQPPKGLLNAIGSVDHFAIDSDVRRQSRSDARLRCSQITKIIALSNKPKIVFYKVDSLLRGHLDVIVSNALKSGPVVMCLANPATGRATRDGVVFVESTALHETEHWNLESEPVPINIASTLRRAPHELLPLQAIRGSLAELRARIQSITSAGRIVLCDAESESDLQALVRASSGIAGLQYLGAAGLARALGQELGAQSQHASTVQRAERHSPKTGILVAVGSGSAVSAEQMAKLAERGVACFEAAAAEQKSVLAAQHSTGAAVVRFSGELKVSDDLLGAFAESSLVLTGGETARNILDALGAQWIETIGELEPGVVAVKTDRGQLAIIKPGTYGTNQTLVNAVSFLRALNQTEKSKS